MDRATNIRVHFLIAIFMLCGTLFASAQITFTSVTSGNWSDGATWGNTSPGVQGTDWPGTSDHVIVTYGNTVSLIANRNITNFTINLGGQFDFNGFTINPFGTVTPFVAQVSGGYDAAGTWLNGSAPSTTDDVVITVDVQVVLNSNTTLNTMNVNSSGRFSLDEGSFKRTLLINGNLFLNGIIVGSNDVNFTGGAGTTIDGAGVVNAGDLVIYGDASITSTPYLTVVQDILMVNAGTTTNNGTVIINMALKSTGTASTWVNAANSTLRVASSLFNGGGNLEASATGNTVVYNEDGPQTIKDPVSSYYNLTISGTGTKSLSANTTLLGSLFVESGTLDIQTNDLTIGGDFTNWATFDASAAKVTFDGSADQTFTSSGGITFSDLEINKAGGTLIMDDDIIVSSTLTMTQGVVNAGANILTLGTGTANEGTLVYLAGQLVGQFQRWIDNTTITTDIFFPVGSADNAQMATINFTGITVGGTVTFQFVQSNPGNAGLSLTDGTVTVNNTFVDGYWDMSIANSFRITGGDRFNLNLDGDGFVGFTIAPETRLLTRDDSGSDWLAEGTHVAAVGDVVNRDALSSMPAQYAFGDSTSCSPPTTSSITGTADVCSTTTGIAYSVVNTGGSTYAWTITGGIQASGGSTNSITVDWGGAGVEGNVRVVETNGCTSGSPVDFAVDVNTIAPSSISGKLFVPEVTAGVAYSVTARTGYTYAWTITGGTQASGGTTNSITVDWGVTTFGNVSVVAQKAGCAAAAAVDIDVVVYDVINTITSGDWDVGSTWETGIVPETTESARIMNGHTVTLRANEEINNLIITNLGIINHATQTLTVNGDLTVDGFCQGTSKDLILSGTNKTIEGYGVIWFVVGGKVSITGNKTIAFATDLTIGSTALPGAGTGIIDLGSGVTVTNNGSVTIIDDLIGKNATSIWTNAENSTLTIGSELFTSNGVLDATAVGNTVVYDGSAQNIHTSTYENLTLGGTGTYTLLAATQINSDLILAGGSLAAAGNTITFGGTSAQTITDLSAGIAFGGLTFDNVTTTLSGDVTVSAALTMTNGIVDVPSGTASLTMLAGSSSTDGNANSYVDGPMKKVGNTDFIFPVGDATVWAPVGLTAVTGGSATTEFTGEYFFIAAPNPADLPASGLDHVSEMEYWNVDNNTTDVTSADLTFYWKDADRSGITDLTTGVGQDLVAVHYNSGTPEWEVLATTINGGSTTGVGGTGSITATFTAFSPVGFGSALGINALPIELNYFKAFVEQNTVLLKWETASETNNDYFTVERSSDGLTFYEIAEVAGAGTSLELNQYAHLDRSPLNGISYYRLQQTDFNGSNTFSKVVLVELDLDDFRAPTLEIYPNPVAQGRTLSYRFTSGSEGIGRIAIQNAMGQLIQEAQIEKSGYELQNELAVPMQLKAGVYIVAVIVGNDVANKRLIVR